MLKQKDHPVAWALWLDELADAHEHLGDLIRQMSEAGEIEPESLVVDLGHVFAHLNRAWHSRDDADLADISAAEFERRSGYPADLAPVG